MKRKSSSMWTLLLAIPIGYGLLVVLMYFMQDYLVYFPTRVVPTTPADLDLEYDDVYLTTADQIRVHGWWIPADSAQATVIVCHGNGGNIGHRLETIRIFRQLALNVFIFDYRGYGQSEGKPTEEGTYRDAAAAWQFVTGEKGVPVERLILFGRSLGGAVASRLAERHPPAALILESTFTSLPDAGAAAYPFLPVRLLARHRYDTAERLPRIHCPVLVIHSPDDEIVPFHLGQKVYERANPPKEFFELNGGHNEGFLVSITAYRAKLKAFIRLHLE